MKLNNRSNVNELLKQYVSPSSPLGAVDHDNIMEPECTARLYEWQNTAFAQLLQGSHVIIGRRGAGKSALLIAIRDSTVHVSTLTTEDSGTKFQIDNKLSEEHIRSLADYVLDIRLPWEIQLLPWEIQLLKRRDFGGNLRPAVEIVARYWLDRIFFCIGEQVFKNNSELWDSLSRKSQLYVGAEDILLIDTPDKEADEASKSFANEIKSVLSKKRKRSQSQLII